MTARSKISLALLALVTALVLVPLAAAHAEMSPEEAVSGKETRFTLSLENEMADSAFVKVVVQFPESVVTATFVQVPGWTRTVKTKPLDTPATGPDGEEITERIDTVTWEGGSVGPGEEGEFPFSFVVPEQPGATLFFPTLQTYDNGETVRWIGAPGSEEPAPGVLITPGEGGGGETTTESVTTTVATTVTTEPESTSTADTTDTTDTLAAEPTSGDDDGSSWPLFLGILALLAAIALLAWWLYKRRQDGEPPADDIEGPGGPGGPPPGGPPPVDPAAPSGGAAMPGGGQAPAPPEAETQLIDPAEGQETQRIDPDDWPQR